MLDGLVRVQRTVEHVHLLLENSKIAAIRAVLNVKNWVLVMFYLLDDAGILDVKYSEDS